jgi:predicted nucleotidyltransferase
VILHRPFEAVAPTLDGTVLLVLARADAAFTGGDLARLIPNASADGVRKAAQRLVTQGVVTLERVGRAYTYRLNREHLVADAVVEIARARERFDERVRAHVEGWANPPESVLLFGSAARGEMHPDSDLDLLVVADHSDGTDEAVNELAAAVTTWTGNDARIVHLSPQEVREAFRAGDALMNELLADGQALYGPSRYPHRVRREVAS